MNAEAITGLYVHIPFCDGKCPYCAFYSVPYQSARADEYLAALAGELAAGPRVAPVTVYLGGGTPTILTPRQLRRLGALLAAAVDLSCVREWTAEANPTSLDEHRLECLLGMGVNRISLGAQFLDDAALRLLGRRHTAADVRTACQRLQTAGVRNWGLDLIACVPGVALTTWQHTLDEALALAPPHISVYALTVEEGSTLGHGASAACLDDAEQLAWLQMAEDRLGAAGYGRYEISNYARPGWECRHNLACWRGEDYLGIGCAAASRVGLQRWRNVANLDAYLAAARTGQPPPRETETVPPETAAVERLLFGLRLAEGVRLEEAARLAGSRHAACAASWRRTLGQLREHGLVCAQDDCWQLTARGREVADAVAVELLAAGPDFSRLSTVADLQ